MEPLRVAVFRYHLPVVAALADGDFAAAGLAAEFVTVRSSNHQRELVETGAADLAHTAADNVAAWHSAAHPWSVTHVIDLGLPHRLVTSPACRSLAELRGRRIAVDSARSGFVRLLRAVLDENSLTGAVEFVEVGALQSRLDALRAGAVDACLLGAEQLQQALDAGARALFALNDFFPQYPGLVVSTIRPPDERTARYVEVLEQAAARALDPTAADRTRRGVGSVFGVDAAAADIWYQSELLRCTGRAAGLDQRGLLNAAWRASGRVREDQVAPVGWYRPVGAESRDAAPAARDATAS